MALRASGSGPLVASAPKSLTPLNPPSSHLALPLKVTTPATAHHHHTTPQAEAHLQQPPLFRVAPDQHTAEHQQPYNQNAVNPWLSDKPGVSQHTAPAHFEMPDGHFEEGQSGQNSLNSWDPNSTKHAQHVAAGRDGGTDRDGQQRGAFGNPLRQKSGLAAAVGEDEQFDVIPALPHVIYSKGGQSLVKGGFALKSRPEGCKHLGLKIGQAITNWCLHAFVYYCLH